jgi:hypothetical protein
VTDPAAALAGAAAAGAVAGPESAKAGPLGLLVILLLGVATYLLIRSMNRHLRKVPLSFDPPPGGPDERRGPDERCGPDERRDPNDRRDPNEPST